MDTTERMQNYGGYARPGSQFRRVKHKAQSRKTHAHRFYEDPDHPGKFRKYRCPQCQPGRVQMASLRGSGLLGVADEMSRLRDADVTPPPVEIIRTESGKVLTDADIQGLADEAERGYDIRKLRARLPRFRRSSGPAE